MTGGSRRFTPAMRKRGEWFRSMPPKLLVGLIPHFFEPFQFLFVVFTR